MEQAGLLAHTTAMLWTVVAVSAPALVIAALVGLAVGLLQAVTQVQDQTLPQVIKIIAVLTTLALTGALLAGPVIRQAERVFTEFPALGR